MPKYYENKDSEYQIEIKDYNFKRKHNLYVPSGFFNKIKVSFLFKNKIHRTDGPAIVTWDINKTGTSRFYYLDDIMCDQYVYLKVLNEPIERMPLYLNNYPYSLIAKDRLQSSYSDIILDNSSYLEPDIREKANIWTKEQVLIKNLIKDLIGNLNKAITKNLRKVKPFKI